jgi:hypothetical protein
MARPRLFFSGSEHYVNESGLSIPHTAGLLGARAFDDTHAAEFGLLTLRSWKANSEQEQRRLVEYGDWSDSEESQTGQKQANWRSNRSGAATVFP